MAVPTPYQDWTKVHNPNAATQATATQAAQAAPDFPPSSNFKPDLLVNQITASIATGATAQTPIHVYLRDGATGAGTIIWSAVLSAPANSVASISVNDLQVRVTSGNATLEFEAAGVAASVQSVAMSGRNLNYGGT